MGLHYSVSRTTVFPTCIIYTNETPFRTSRGAGWAALTKQGRAAKTSPVPRGDRQITAARGTLDASNSGRTYVRAAWARRRAPRGVRAHVPANTWPRPRAGPHRAAPRPARQLAQRGRRRGGPLAGPIRRVRPPIEAPTRPSCLASTTLHRLRCLPR